MTSVRRDPLYEQVASEFRRKIDLGVLRVGEKLPSVRALRNGRRVSTATVMEAYLRLERDGYVRVRDRSGFYVVQPPHHAIPQPSTGRAVAPPVPVGISALVAEVLLQGGRDKLVPLGVSTIDPGLLPMPRLNRAFRRVLARWPLHSARYTGLSGAAALRRQIARRALALGTALDADEVIVTAGGLDALNLALRAVASPAMSWRSKARPTSGCCRRSKPSACAPSRFRPTRAAASISACWSTRCGVSGSRPSW